MRVLVLCTDAYGGHGGIALYTRDLIESIASHPHVDEVVAIPRVMPHASEPIPSNVRFVASAARNAASYMRAITGAGKKFDLVVCAHINLLPVARLLRCRTALMIYGIEAWKRPRAASARLVDHVDAVVSISDVTRERFASWSQFDGRSFLLPNAIHLERYAERPRNPELVARWKLDGKRVLLTLGRIVAAERYKGFDEVLDVLPDLLRDHPDLAYVVAGTGSDVPRLQKKAERLGVAQCVVFTGMVDEHEKSDIYNLADVYVMPSRGEGFGFVFLEALACGVPVIASRIDGGREAVRDGELGLLVDPSNPAEVRTAIDDTLASGKHGVPAGLSHFAFPRFESRVHSLVDELTA
jgi:glycosyltransferase involved in cell wall biosynthesis